MNIQVIQHSAADSPASAALILDQLGHLVSTTRIDRGDPIPQRVTADVLMMFGGGISLTASDLPPWVDQERELIRQYVDQGRRVMGICLGAQLLASALGATVQRNLEPEAGWHRVFHPDGSTQSGPATSLPREMMAFHWHQDTFDIPPGATHLYQSEACTNQAFAMGDRVFGFQFHFEANERTVLTFLAVSKLWRRQASFIQSEDHITEGIESYLATQTAHLASFLGEFCPAD